ncbi:MAG: hypothetical protein HY823_05360 [Acidobacteria bacterium]|nr:hypothetical protein [Acidobacteriota bacterium]
MRCAAPRFLPFRRAQGGFASPMLSLMAAVGLWTFVEALEAARPFSAKAVETLTGATLERVDGNPHYTLLYAGPRGWPVEQRGRLGTNAHQVPVTSVDLRLERAGATGGSFLVVGLGPGAATRAELLARHPDAVPEPPNPGPPGGRGTSAPRPDTYWVKRPWGRLAYGVLKEGVVSVAFHEGK